MLHIDTVQESKHQTSKHESFTDSKYEGAMHSTELSTIPRKPSMMTDYL